MTQVRVPRTLVLSSGPTGSNSSQITKAGWVCLKARVQTSYFYQTAILGLVSEFSTWKMHAASWYWDFGGWLMSFICVLIFTGKSTLYLSYYPLQNHQSRKVNGWYGTCGFQTCLTDTVDGKTEVKTTMFQSLIIPIWQWGIWIYTLSDTSSVLPRVTGWDVTGGCNPTPDPCPTVAFPPPWDTLLWESLAVTLLLVQEAPPPASESSMFPPLLQPAPQPFLNLNIIIIIIKTIASRLRK